MFSVCGFLSIGIMSFCSGSSGGSIRSGSGVRSSIRSIRSGSIRSSVRSIVVLYIVTVYIVHIIAVLIAVV